MKRNILIGSLVAIIAVMGTAPVLALPGANQVGNAAKRVLETKLEDTGSELVKNGHAAPDQVANTVVATLTPSERRAQQKAELNARLEAKKQARQTRLEGRRLAKCQNRQVNINALIDRSAENGQRHLTNIQRVEDRVKAFVQKKSLDSESYQMALAAAETKRAEAAATLDVLTAQNFDCASADGDKPSDTLHMTYEARRTALRAYRDSVIELIHVVKASFATTQSAQAADTEASR